PATALAALSAFLSSRRTAAAGIATCCLIGCRLGLVTRKESEEIRCAARDGYKDTDDYKFLHELVSAAASGDGSDPAPSICRRFLHPLVVDKRTPVVQERAQL